MFIAIQFPLVDTRAFVNTQANRLSYPTWPLPYPDREFIRGSGIVKRRRRGGLDSWPGEEIYCSAKRALRFQPLLSNQPVGSIEKSVYLICAFRRFLFDGEAVSRVELGFKAQVGEGGKQLFSLDGQEILDLIDGCLSTKVRVPSADGSLVTCDLSGCGQHLAKHYLRSTTQRVEGNLAYTEDWWLSPGTPLLLIEYKQGEINKLPKYAQSVDQTVKVSSDVGVGTYLTYCQIERAGKRLGVWFVETYLSNLDLVRRIRMHLFRLHAERECLKQVLRLILHGKLQPGVRTDSSDRLQQYLRDSTRLLSKQARYGLLQSRILEEVQKFDDIINPGERATLLSQLSKIYIRENIYHNVEGVTKGSGDSIQNIHILGPGNSINIGTMQRIGGNEMTKYEIKFGDNVKISGDFVVANTIQGSLNKISSSDASEKIKEKLTQLSEAVAEMCNHLPKDDARAATRDLEALTSEVLSEKPRRRWYEINAEGLIETARSIGQAATPVITAISSLLALLG